MAKHKHNPRYLISLPGVCIFPLRQPRPMYNLTQYKQSDPVAATINYLNAYELIAEKGNEFLFDVECFPNLFLIGFMSYTTGRVTFIERSNYCEFDRPKLDWILKNMVLTGFNSKSYDLPMIWAAMANLNCGQLHAISNQLILGAKAWHLEKKFGFKQFPKYVNHVDLREVAPAAAQMLGLKHYGARMHVPNLQHLPLSPQSDLTLEQSQKIKLYNVNDLIVTGYLRHSLDAAIELRKNLGVTYGTDLRSLSDAQIAERVISTELQSLTGIEPFVPKIPAGTKFQFQNPAYMQFYTADLQTLHKQILNTDFVVANDGTVKLLIDNVEVNATNRWTIKINKTVYRLGIGGLHSSETNQSFYSDSENLIFDRDVASYYPAIILNQKLFPAHLGLGFLQTYEDIVKRRLQAKKFGHKTTANSLKITINGCFGKLGSRFSVFYSPHLLIQVTLTGQLSLLMLIEMLEWQGIRVISANTDGIIIRCPQGLQDAYTDTIRAWEAITGFETEETRYKSVHSRDVNNYIAIGEDGSIKAKGAYTNDLSFKEKNRESLMSNPSATISSEAVMLFLRDGVPVEQTIRKCRDIRKFLSIRRVNGGAVKDGTYLGKIVRWYMQVGEFGDIRTAEPNAAGITTIVSESTGAQPLMTLPTSLPRDIDYEWYIRRANSMLYDLGVNRPKDLQMELF